jgi:hypothetical protein
MGDKIRLALKSRGVLFFKGKEKARLVGYAQNKFSVVQHKFTNTSPIAAP